MMLFTRASTLSSVGVLVLAITGCGGGGGPVTVEEPTAVAVSASASSDPSEGATPSAEPKPKPRPMEVGDCLEKVGEDELGLPIPEYVDCSEPHTFEVTAVIEPDLIPVSWDFDAMMDSRKAECKRQYTAYTGRAIGKGSGNLDSAFGWDQPSEAAFEAGVHTIVCYASRPWLERREGSQRAGS